MCHIQTEFAVKICQCVLQSRLDANKNWLEMVSKRVHSQQHGKKAESQSQIHQILGALIKQEQYSIRKKMEAFMKAQEKITVEIIFTLDKKSNGSRNLIEIWQIQFSKWDAQCNSENVFAFTEELLLLLGSTSLSDYHGNFEMKNQFMLNYSFNFGKKQIEQIKIPWKILQIERNFEPFQSKITCKFAQNIQSLKRSEISVVPIEQLTRKASICSFYDNQVECILISSQQLSIRSSKGQIDQKQLIYTSVETNAESQEIQILYSNEDEALIEQNQGYFQQLGLLSSSYFQ